MTRRKPTKRSRRKGAALLVVIFVVFMVSSLVLNMLTTETQQSAVARNVRDYERALYLANAGVHHACALLAEDDAYRGTITDGAYPADDTYSATVADGVDGQVDVVSVGVAGEAARTVEATIEW
ncbi:hypothetical protein KOR34_03890 [Posidoniimonas corsicana]|uniref:Type 4 fimbrial biogenesis protein PilX N-terminal domain-containing protein n=1 Tax=Posidoniimonas corsicana TaxID=1938618 RepID=A0A5C5VBZ8_9BACT|nr:hypothetical protein [Posidoniimonas corsicana]TWT35497.1 hypothetical protein KOR34_03890 [Posidoniimonas corsicana]